MKRGVGVGRWGERRDDKGCLVRLQICLSALPGMVRGLFHLSEEGDGPEPTDHLSQSPLDRILITHSSYSALKT